MRLDYALYGLAAILFVLTAIDVAYITEPTTQIVYATLTAVVGLICLVGGYFLKPKTTTTATAPNPQPAAAEQSSPAETPVVETPQAEVQTEAPQPETAPEPASPMESESVAEEPKPETPTVTEEAPKAEVQAAPVANAFSQIRGINQKRAEQLASNGVTSIEELANASADELAEKLGVSPRIVKMWIGCAKKLVK
ncbi:MAG: helix-hairpin-helix domain-containing protein [Candidatus Bathyarchaeota archaeon]|nr:helix-hairpin-helix domain-containing protein [Candidatus Bathyarchaeota archaeon]